MSRTMLGSHKLSNAIFFTVWEYTKVRLFGVEAG